VTTDECIAQHTAGMPEPAPTRSAAAFRVDTSCRNVDVRRGVDCGLAKRRTEQSVADVCATFVGLRYHCSMSVRERLSATVEAELLEAGRAAVADGRAESLSAWVNAALRRQADHDRRMKALDSFLDSYEAEHGAITEDEMQAATRRARTRAVVVRGPEKAQEQLSERRTGAVG
jgi:hypothetical protein